MKISTKGRYGIKAMLDLALNNGEGVVSLSSIAKRQEVSENYLEQLFAVLRKAGLVKSVRGAKGGYHLAKSSEEITIGNILRALEGSLAPVECVGDEPTECQRSEKCVTRVLWQKIRECVEKLVDSITLKDLVDDYNNRFLSNDGYDYYI